MILSCIFLNKIFDLNLINEKYMIKNINKFFNKDYFLVKLINNSHQYHNKKKIILFF